MYVSINVEKKILQDSSMLLQVTVDLYIQNTTETTHLFFKTRLLHQKPRVGQSIATALGPGRTEEGPHASGQPNVDRLNLVAHCRHRIIDGQRGPQQGSRHIEVHVDGLVSVFVVQVPENGHDLVGHTVVDELPAQQDAVVIQALVDAHVAVVVCAGGLVGHGRLCGGHHHNATTAVGVGDGGRRRGQVRPCAGLDEGLIVACGTCRGQDESRDHAVASKGKEQAAG